VAEILGGEKVLRRRVRSELDLADVVRDGLPVRAVDHVLRAAVLELDEVSRLVIPSRTLHRRKAERQPLTPGESERLARVVRVAARAREVLGAAEKAHRWLRKGNRALDGRRPLDLLGNDVGARMVEAVLGRIEHGIPG
jgi:putative toxin-antitoxin system antitoxin component (TIGR02293 family)